VGRGDGRRTADPPRSSSPRQAPGPLERAAWSDAAGEPVPLLAPPAEGGGWAVAADDDADGDGWSYGSVFAHLPHARRGGRASQRIGDFVRRRRWLRAAGGGGDAAATPSSPILAPRPTAAARKAAESARRAASMRAFVALMLDTARRLRLWSLLPLDPAAPVVLAPRHAARLAADAKLFASAAVDLTGGGEEGGGEAGTGGQDGDDSLPPLPRASDLVAAALHARAAYGYAAAAGHLVSLSSYALMHTVKAVEFDAAGGASAAANSAAACELAGVARSALIMADWTSSVSRPCHFVAADEAGQRIVLSIRWGGGRRTWDEGRGGARPGRGGGGPPPPRRGQGGQRWWWPEKPPMRERGWTGSLFVFCFLTKRGLEPTLPRGWDSLGSGLGRAFSRLAGGLFSEGGGITGGERERE